MEIMTNMGLLQDIKYRLRKSGVLIFFIMLTVYFCFNGFYGDRGYRKYMYLKNEVATARVMADQYRKQKEMLNDEVKLLSPGSLDLDMLDERARDVLGMVGSGELILLDE